jgi:hypothetical protein
MARDDVRLCERHERGDGRKMTSGRLTQFSVILPNYISIRIREDINVESLHRVMLGATKNYLQVVPCPEGKDREGSANSDRPFPLPHHTRVLLEAPNFLPSFCGARALDSLEPSFWEWLMVRAQHRHDRKPHL